MRKLLALLMAALLINILGTAVHADNSTEKNTGIKAADTSLVLLKEGNIRFMKGSSVYPNQTSHQRKLLALKGQTPLATIVTAADSRVDPVLIFDRGLGDLYTIRTAGNVAGSDALASVEFSMLSLNTPLLIVMGNTGSPIIKAAVNKTKMKGHMVQLLGKLEPAIKMTRVMNPSLEGDKLVNKVAETNVRQVMRDILGHCPEVLNKIRSGKAQIMGAIYDTDSGAVYWLGP